MPITWVRVRGVVGTTRVTLAVMEYVCNPHPNFSLGCKDFQAE